MWFKTVRIVCLLRTHHLGASPRDGLASLSSAPQIPSSDNTGRVVWRWGVRMLTQHLQSCANLTFTGMKLDFYILFIHLLSGVVFVVVCFVSALIRDKCRALCVWTEDGNKIVQMQTIIVDKSSTDCMLVRIRTHDDNKRSAFRKKKIEEKISVSLSPQSFPFSLTNCHIV